MAALDITVLSTMRLCLVGTKSCPPVIGGIEVFVYEIGRRLAAGGTEVTVIAPRASGRRDDEYIDGMRVVRVKAIRNRFALKASMIPHETIKLSDIRPDILHANDPISGAIGASHMSWTKYILSVHGIGFSLSEWPTPFRQGGKLLQKTAAKGADVVTVTDSVTASMLNCDRSRMRIIPTGVDTSLFSKGAHKRPEGFDSDKFNIIHAGRLARVKGTDLLLKCLDLIPKQILNAVSFKIIGSGPLASMVAEAARSYSFVEWLGEIPHNHVAPYFANADMFLMPSRSEGLPISMLEAMSCNVPVLSTMVGGIGAYFDERHVVKIEEPTAKAVAEAIELAVRNRATVEAKAVAAKGVVDKRFSWDAVAGQFEGVYHEVLNC